MPTAPTSPKSPKATANARKPAPARPAAAKRTTRASTRGTTQAKATQAKGARTRATHQAEAAVKQAQTATRETADVFGDYAERAVLIPVGAALIARERIVSTVNDTVSTYASPSKTQAQMRRFERRGV